jgi:RNA-binding protein
VIALDQLFQLENGARTQALGLGLFYVDIVEMLPQPAGTTFAARHGWQWPGTAGDHDTLYGPRRESQTEHMALSPSQQRYLRSLAHDLHPVILLGAKGATEAVVKELDLALSHHELVKVKLSGGDKEDRAAQINTLIEGTGAESVQQIGHIVVLFRRNEEDPRVALPR